MLPAPRLSRLGRAYVSAVVAAGFLVISYSVHELLVRPVGFQWFLLALLTLVSGSATVKLPSVPASISISETFVFAAVLLYGPSAGTIIVALDGLVASFWISKRHQELYRALFNMSAPALSAWAASQLFFLVAGVRPLLFEAAPLNQILPALILFALTYFGFNSSLIAFAIAIEKSLPAFKVWRENFVWLSLNYFCGASVAVLLVSGNRDVDLRFVGVIVPLLLVLYFTFKTSMARVEDANRHVEKVNRLYLSTIETLALAVDAKDQVTHGHIRRVQRYAVGLARELGVVDSILLKAIEAAALLHDMGKLAVPEYILNKPGKLTPAEFERMKLHASVGADILSAIDFPYPVVPIVRHHHESWDGSGYPDGLKGTDIPIGARVISVIDCFDALTSDRPYRRRLSDEDALTILRDRKGSMYDPWVVDVFANIYKTLDAGEFAEQSVGATASVTDALDMAVRTPPQRQPLALEYQVTLECEALLHLLRSQLGADLAVFFRYDIQRDDLFAQHSAGECAQRLHGRRFQLGQGTTGWVAANRLEAVNADAALDLKNDTGLLRFCLSVPVALGANLLGVISLYSSDRFRAGSDQAVAEAVNAVLRDAVTRSTNSGLGAPLQYAS